MMLALTLSGAAWSETVIHAGKMVDASTGEVREAVTIVVDGERIQSVEAGYQGTADIDLTDAFVMPGWIDMHVHIASQQSPNRFVEGFTQEPADSALRAVPCAWAVWPATARPGPGLSPTAKNGTPAWPAMQKRRRKGT